MNLQRNEIDNVNHITTNFREIKTINTGFLNKKDSEFDDETHLIIHFQYSQRFCNINQQVAQEPCVLFLR